MSDEHGTTTTEDDTTSTTQVDDDTTATETATDDTSDTDDTGTDSQRDDAKPADGKNWQAEVDKWKALARKNEQQAKANHAELQKLKTDQDASKPEMQQLLERIEAAEARAAEGERKALIAEVAEEKGLTVAQANRLTGSNREELLEDADHLRDLFGLNTKPDTKPQTKPAAQRPKEKLRAGTTNNDDDGRTDADIADAVLKRRM
jgi:propanediol dehydratase small subunit